MLLEKIKTKLGLQKQANTRLSRNFAHRRYHSADFSKSASVDYDKVQQLTAEVCKLQNEATQVPVLKAKLDVLQNELKLEKAKYNSIIYSQESTKTRLNDSLNKEKQSKDLHLGNNSSNEIYQNSVFSSSAVLLVPPRNHRRNASSVTSFSNSSDQSLFSIHNDSIQSNAELDLQLTYEETNKSLLEKLKMQEMRNIKLRNQIAQLERTVSELSRSVDEERKQQHEQQQKQQQRQSHRKDSMVTAETSLDSPELTKSTTNLTINIELSNAYNPSEKENLDPASTTTNGSTALETPKSHNDGNSVFSFNINFDNLVEPASNQENDFFAKGTSVDNDTQSNTLLAPNTPDTPDFSTFTMDQQTSTPTKPKQNDNSIANDAVLYFPQTPKKTGAELHRNEYFCKTLRKRSSHESLLSLNKPLNKPNGLGIENVNDNISSTRKERRQSKNLYYVVRDEAKDFNMNTSSSSSLVSHKRSSLMNYCTNQLHKVSPRPKSSIMF